MSLVVYGLLRLISVKKMTFRIVLNLRLVGRVTLLFCPLILVVLLDPSSYILLYVIKMYIVVLYLTLYFKSMRFTHIEWICFAIPLVVSMYYFMYPRVSDFYQLSLGRGSGISDPNFTSLSLIYSMCGAFGVFALAKAKNVKMTALIIVMLCFAGVLYTASRAGFLGASVAVCLFFVFGKRIRSAGMVAVLAVFFVIVNLSGVSHNMPLVFQRFMPSGGWGLESVVENSSGRDILADRAWRKISHGDWFVAGGPRNVTLFSGDKKNVPHNSFLDIGLAFGKFPFYFYSTLLFLLFVLNIWEVSKTWRCRNTQEKKTMLVTTLFLSLLPMYLSLSAGMSMGFQLWTVLGAYPLLNKSTVMSKDNNFFHHRVKW